MCAGSIKHGHLRRGNLTPHTKPTHCQHAYGIPRMLPPHLLSPSPEPPSTRLLLSNRKTTLPLSLDSLERLVTSRVASEDYIPPDQRYRTNERYRTKSLVAAVSSSLASRRKKGPDHLQGGALRNPHPPTPTQPTQPHLALFSPSLARSCLCISRTWSPKPTGTGNNAFDPIPPIPSQPAHIVASSPHIPSCINQSG